MHHWLRGDGLRPCVTTCSPTADTFQLTTTRLEIVTRNNSVALFELLIVVSKLAALKLSPGVEKACLFYTESHFRT